MLTAITRSGAIATGAFLVTSTLLSSSLAEAKYRRVTAATSCHEDVVFEKMMEIDNIGVLASDDEVVSDVVPTVDRYGTGVTVVNDPFASGEPIRCEVPTDSYLPHQTMTEAHVSGYKSAGNGYASYAKACYTWFANGSYSCTANHNLPSGYFNEVLDLGAIWSNWASFPMINMVLSENDSVYGVYYTDA